MQGRHRRGGVQQQICMHSHTCEWVLTRVVSRRLVSCKWAPSGVNFHLDEFKLALRLVQTQAFRVLDTAQIGTRSPYAGPIAATLLDTCLQVQRCIHTFEPSPMSTSCPSWCHSHDECCQAFPILHQSSASGYCFECKPKYQKGGEAWEQGYVDMEVNEAYTYYFCNTWTSVY